MGSQSSAIKHRVRPDIQGLRAVAVGAVVAFHAGFLLPGGYLGVDVFFVISGYVVSQSIWRNFDAGRNLRLRNFAFRRFRRLAPEFFLVLGVALLLTFALLPERSSSVLWSGIFAAAGLSNAWFSQHYVGYFAETAKLDPLLHFWSLAVEEQFYLGLALGSFLLFKVFSGARGSFVRKYIFFVAAASLFSLVLAVIGWSDLRLNLPFGQGLLGYYSPLPRIWEFGVGILLARLSSARYADAWPTGRRILGWSSLVTLLVVFAWPTASETGMRLVATLAAVGATALLIYLGSSSSTASASRALSAPPMVFVGDRSYSIYLWHWPLIVVIDGLSLSGVPEGFGAIVGIVLALASHRFVGSPWRMSTGRDASKLSALVLTGVSPILLLGGVAGTVPDLRITEGVVVLSGQKTETLGRSSGCLLQRDFIESDIERCEFGEGAGWVALVGDSHADALSDGTVRAAGTLGLRTLALTGAGCDFTRVPHNFDEEISNCHELTAGLLSRFSASDPPAAVILSQTGISDEVSVAVREVQKLGVPVVLVRDVPWIQPLRDLSPGASSYAEGPCVSAEGQITCEVSRPAAESTGLRKVEDALIRQLDFDYVVDPWETLCDQRNCYGILGSQILYWDDHHLNANGSILLADMLAEALTAVANPVFPNAAD